MSAVATALTVRPAVVEDAARIAEIWNREALETLGTTDTEPRDLAAQRAWLAAHSPEYPALVGHLTAVGGQVQTDVQNPLAGFAALAPYRPKPAFRRTVEDSVYVDRRWRGHGVGGCLLAHLLDAAMAAGHRSVIARITAQNLASRRLHEKLGFRLVGVEEDVAFKLGRWIDVAIYQRRLCHLRPVVSALHCTGPPARVT